MKGLGYVISTLSVLLLAIVAWPAPEEPRWKVVALGAGAGTSVLGMLVRYLSHRRDRRDIDEAKHS